MRAIGFFVRLEHGLVVIACEGRSGYVVSMKLHGSVPATRMLSDRANRATYRNLPGFILRTTNVDPFETMDLTALHEIPCGVARSTEQDGRGSFCLTSDCCKSRRGVARPGKFGNNRSRMAGSVNQNFRFDLGARKLFFVPAPKIVLLTTSAVNRLMRCSKQLCVALNGPTQGEA